MKKQNKFLTIIGLFLMVSFYSCTNNEDMFEEDHSLEISNDLTKRSNSLLNVYKVTYGADITATERIDFRNQYVNLAGESFLIKLPISNRQEIWFVQDYFNLTFGEKTCNGCVKKVRIEDGNDDDDEDDEEGLIPPDFTVYLESPLSSSNR